MCNKGKQTCYNAKYRGVISQTNTQLTQSMHNFAKQTRYSEKTNT